MAKEQESVSYQVVVFELGEETYCIKISDVYEIVRMQEITKIPKVEEFIEGVINLRSKIIPIIDLRKRFNIERKKNTKQQRIIVVKIDNEIVGMIVDSVSEVLQITSSQIEEMSSLASSPVETEFISGIVKIDNKLIIMLDLQNVLTRKEKKYLKEDQSLVLANENIMNIM